MLHELSLASHPSSLSLTVKISKYTPVFTSSNQTEDVSLCFVCRLGTGSIVRPVHRATRTSQSLAEARATQLAIAVPVSRTVAKVRSV